MKKILVTVCFVFIFSGLAKTANALYPYLMIHSNSKNQLVTSDAYDGFEPLSHMDVPGGTIFAVDGDYIYLHDVNSSSYQLCTINFNSVIECAVILVDNFKTKKMAVINSRLYMLGNTVRSCSIGRNHSIGECVNESHLPVNSGNSGGYTKIQLTPSKKNIAPSEKNKVILTDVLGTSTVCEIKNDQLTSCKGMGEGIYHSIPGQSHRIYKFEPALKKIMLCDYDPVSSSASNCTPIMSNFDLVADDMAFIWHEGGVDPYWPGYLRVFIRDTQSNLLVSCRVNTDHYTLSACRNHNRAGALTSSPVIFPRVVPPSSSSINTYYRQDGFAFFKKDSNLAALCNTLDKKNLLCAGESRIKTASGVSSVFIRDYALNDTSSKQYAYLPENSGRTLTECSFNPDDVLKGAIDHCKIRKDINFPVEIVSGSVLSEVNMLLLTGRNSEVYQCNYNAENRLESCKNTGLANIDFTHTAFGSAYQKVYFYSKKGNKMNACNIVNQRIRNCHSVKLNSSITGDTVQDIAITPNFSHMLFADKSAINYCGFDRWEPRLKECIRLSDNFSNVTSMAYSKTDRNRLYILDNKIMKACSINDKDPKINCNTIDTKADIAGMPVNKFTVSANYLRAGISLLPVTIKNKGGYTLEATYGTYSEDKKRRVPARRKLTAGRKFVGNVLMGSAVELHALSGHKKCIFIDKPGKITCTGSIFNMACYYNGSSEKVINHGCWPESFKVRCTPGVVNVIKLMVRDKNDCKYDIREDSGIVRAICQGGTHSRIKGVYRFFDCKEMLKKVYRLW